jgi:dephospho-CoA kinase
MLVGITGGIGSGKSAFSGLLVDRGALGVDADLVAREVADDPVVIQQLQETFGEDLLDNEGKLDRRELGRRAFVSDQGSQRLEEIMRPPLAHAIWRKLEQALQSAGSGVVVFDASLIYEWGSGARFDRVVVVDADEEIRVARALARGGLQEAEIRERMARQMDPSEKKARADYVVDNNGNLGDLAVQANRLWGELTLAAKES